MAWKRSTVRTRPGPPNLQTSEDFTELAGVLPRYEVTGVRRERGNLAGRLLHLPDWPERRNRTENDLTVVTRNVNDCAGLALRSSIHGTPHMHRSVPQLRSLADFPRSSPGPGIRLRTLHRQYPQPQYAGSLCVDSSCVGVQGR